jgi:cytochrome c
MSADHDYGGLPDEARTLLYFACSACHSIHLVKQQGLNRKRWQETLEWMVDEQGMESLPTQDQERILDYLAKHFGEGRKARKP